MTHTCRGDRSRLEHRFTQRKRDSGRSAEGRLDGLPAWIQEIDDAALGEELIQIREAIDRLEAVFADGLRRFDKSGEYASDGALSVVAWLRWKCRLSDGAAAERVGIARQLAKLPQTEQLCPG